ncbi:uncharacterized protein LOC112560859 [Pomacea canaliculata]|uniref:uncharacterized protein LOC112560859 n=1 Tax=Pomacea canaliculata TaxID=400727 RepID=UPI000D727ABA|nr:uncharacterized protein LOC112560859 [Pomacea canaliculata]
MNFINLKFRSRGETTSPTVSLVSHARNITKIFPLGMFPTSYNASGQLFERNASSSFLILTFPLTENSHGLYTCTTSYRLRDEKRKESQSFYVGGPSTIKKNESVDGFSVNFTPVLRVHGTWNLPALQNPTLVYGSVNISEKFVAGDRETCSSDHPDIAALNFSHIYYAAKNEHILSLDACIKVPTRCGSVVYITGEDKVFITVQVNLNPEEKERGTSADSANRSQPHEKGPDTNTSSPLLQETTHSLTEQRVIFTFLGLFMGISLTCLLVYIKRFCKKRHENPSTRTTENLKKWTRFW